VEKRKASEVVEEPETKKAKQSDEVEGENGAPNLRLFINGLPFAATEESIGEIFKNCGEILQIDMLRDRTTNSFYGKTFIEFKSPEAAKQALAMNGTFFEGRALKIEPQNSKGTPRNQNPRDSFQQSEKPPGCTTAFLGNLSYDIEDSHINSLFADCGEIKQIRWLHDRETNEFKRCGFVEFYEEESVAKAVAHSGEQVLDRPIRIDFQKSNQQQTPQKFQKKW